MGIEYRKNYRDIINHPRPILHHHPMEIAHRAKQFAPFAALKGFEETVEKQEVIYTMQPILSEDQKERLNRRFAELKDGMTVTVTWFEANDVTWTRRITNQVKRKDDDEVRLYQRMRKQEEAGLGRRITGTGKILLGDGILWFQGREEGIRFDQIIDIGDIGS